MADQLIICPNCKSEIPLTQAITQKIEQELRKELEQSFRDRDKELASKEKALAVKEQAIAKSEQEVNDRIEREVNSKLILERGNVAKEAKRRAEAESLLQVQLLKEDLESKDKKLQEAQREQLLLLKQKAELEERERNVDLEVAKRLSSERAGIYVDASRKASEEHQLKDKEKDKNIADLIKQIEELKRKAEQGSQQCQGEVLEIELEQMLKTTFPQDLIEPVAKGVRGADVLQKVHNSRGECCGTIIWESKSAKGWSDSWIDKLKDNQREAKAEIAVLMSLVLPREVNSFAQFKGVWVTEYHLAVALANALRTNLIEVSGAKQAAIGKTEKMEAIYNYLSGSEFKQKIEAIVESFVAMKQDLDKEKMITERLWAKREKQIMRVINNTAKMYGDMQGIIGASLPQIKSLELEAITREATEDKSDVLNT